MLKLLVDENLDQRILRGLLIRIPVLLYVVVQDAGLGGFTDSALLEWAMENHLPLVTHDRRTMLQAAREGLLSGQKIAGLVVVKKELPLASAIEDMALVVECSTEHEIENQIVFIPL